MKKRMTGILLMLVGALSGNQITAMIQTPANSAGEGGPNFAALFWLVGFALATLDFAIGGFWLVFVAGRERIP